MPHPSRPNWALISGASKYGGLLSQGKLAKLGSANGGTEMSATADEPSVRPGYEPQVASAPPLDEVHVAKPALPPIRLSNHELNGVAIARLERIKAKLRSDPSRGGASGSTRSNNARQDIWRDIMSLEEIITRIYGPRELPA